MAENELIELPETPQSVYDIARAAAEEVENGPTERPERSAPVGETPEQRTERERDEGGRFKAKTEEAERPTLKLKDKPAPRVAGPSTEQPLAAGGVDGTPKPPEIDKDGKHLERIAPPADWKGAAKVQWDRLPRPVREEIARSYGEVESARTELAPLKELFDVNREFLVNQAGSVPNAMAQMMQFAHMSVDNPVQLAEHILRARGIDPRAAFTGQPQAPTQGQPQDPQALLAQLVQRELQPILGQFAQQQSQQLQTTIDQFGSDPAHPYFNDVRSHMGTLIQNGQAKTMDEAYEQATWATPAIRAQLLAAQSEAATTAKAAEVAAAKAAQRTSLRGSPLPGGTSAARNGAGQSVFDTVRAAMEEVGG